jgi:hypothetical protein
MYAFGLTFCLRSHVDLFRVGLNDLRKGSEKNHLRCATIVHVPRHIPRKMQSTTYTSFIKPGACCRILESV